MSGFVLYLIFILPAYFRSTHAFYCLDRLNPLEFSQAVVVECSPPSRKRNITPSPDNSISAGLKNVLKFPAANIKTLPVLPQPDGNAKSMIHMDVSCHDGDNALCANVKSALIKTASTISQEYLHVRQILILIGSAAPARTIPLEDEDNVIRFYPQALIKQFNLTSALLYGPYDIQAIFNSDSEFSFDDSITTNQSDFRYVSLHELIHGLGFTSAWDDYVNTADPVSITPHLLFVYPDPSKHNVHFAGFIENAFDRFIQTPTGSLSQKAAQMNHDFGPSTDFISDDALLRSYQNSHAWDIGKDILVEASTANTFKFDGKIVLETSIKFKAGSSVSHVSADLYSSTQDFLMRHVQQQGSTLEECIQKHGDPVYGAFGPGLRAVLGNLGYRVRGGIPTNDPSRKDSTLDSSKITLKASSRSDAQRGASWVTLFLGLWLLLL
ncbi:hypothetical protein NEOLI_003605 [Neolecta irregularis DAH-3]|uniref:Uncharacterized protein n=1 Tax=Neolecta irregularis (strain DAH-3) TaxID=1198029 RepID=A0A1U7LQT3_NEOID|nr:hypothetical protein NEOLI_003605 [Neolecta irregularis DAH-3]|eukprot:OLL24988.1 hypothetical protein NEOLI_003605 [Neolecta irregularis DAH-3]